MGGLEFCYANLFNQHAINRRMGGLECTMLRLFKLQIINRRMGGLEYWGTVTRSMG